MCISILIITHENVGRALLDVATKTFGKLPLPAFAISIDHDLPSEDNLCRVKKTITNINSKDGVLVLTDLYGATPSNLARALEDEAGIKVISGVNLPMLIRVLNYPNECLTILVEKALSGGREGILTCTEQF